MSPRLYVSTNPWKITATFQTISSTREEYVATIDRLRASAPKLKESQRGTKIELAHLALITDLEKRLEAIDAELTVSINFSPYCGGPAYQCLVQPRRHTCPNGRQCFLAKDTATRDLLVLPSVYSVRARSLRCATYSSLKPKCGRPVPGERRLDRTTRI